MANISLPFSFSPNTLIKSADMDAQFAEIVSKFNTYAVQTDVAKTITATHTFTPSQTFNGGIAVAAGITLASGALALPGGAFHTIGGQRFLAANTGPAQNVLYSGGAGGWGVSNQLNSLTLLTVADAGGVSIPLGGLAVVGGITGVGSVQPVGLSADATNTTTTPQATLLAVTLGINQVWRIEFDLGVSCDNVGGIAMSFTAPAGATGRASWTGPLGSATAYSNQSNASFAAATFSTYNSSASPVYVRVACYVTTVGTGGAFTLQFASITGTQTSKVYAGSTLLAARIS